MNRKGNDYFYHTNHLGSVMAVSDRSGTVQERYEYDPFGKVSFYNGVGTQLTKSAIGNEVLFTDGVIMRNPGFMIIEQER